VGLQQNNVKLNKFLLIPSVLLLFLATGVRAHAVCPVCVVAVGAGVGLSRWLGVDDLITGIWLGGLIIATGFWFSSRLKAKKIVFAYETLSVILITYLSVVASLYFTSTLQNSGRLLTGAAIGSVLLLAAIFTDNHIRRLNNNKARISYQKILIPLSYLLLASGVAYLSIS